MRFSAAFGALALGTALFASCGDDGPSGSGPSGSGGSAGTSAIAGSGGSETQTGGHGGLFGSSGCGNSAVSPVCSIVPGGTAGVPDAGDPGDAGSSDASASDASSAPSEPCTGCLELRATVANGDESAFFRIEYETPVDMSAGGATITFRVSGLSPDDDVRVAPFLYDGDYTFYTVAPQDTIELTAADGFTDIGIALDDVTTSGFDTTDVSIVGLLVGYTGGIGAESTADLAILLDAVTFTGIDTPDLAFTTDNESFDRADDIGVTATEVVHR